jgi:hypothetical protein
LDCFRDPRLLEINSRANPLVPSLPFIWDRHVCKECVEKTAFLHGKTMAGPEIQGMNKENYIKTGERLYSTRQ